MKNLFYQGLFWRGLNYFSQFLLTIAMARLLKAGDSGTIYYLINNLAIVILITSLSFESALGYFSAKKEIVQAELISGSLLMTACSVLVSAAIIWQVIVTTNHSLFVPCVLYCSGLVLINYFTALFNSHYDYLFPNLVCSVVNLAIALACIYFQNASGNGVSDAFLPFYFLSFLVAGVVIAGFYMLRYRDGFRFPTLANAKKLFVFAGLALLANLVFFLVYRVDYWFVHRNSTSEELGNYIQVSKIGQIFLLFPGIIGTVVFTRTARNDSHDHLRELQMISRLLLMGYVIVVGVLLLVGYWVFPLVYGSTFRLMYLPFVLLAPGILSLSTLMLVTAYNGGLGDVSSNLRGAVIALAVIIAGNFVFTPLYGIYAAAAVSSLGYIVYQVYIMSVISRRNRELKISAFFLPVASDLNFLKTFFTRNAKQR